MENNFKDINDYQRMDRIVRNRRYFLNSISEKYEITDEGFEDINKIESILREMKIDDLVKDREKYLNDFVDSFYKWHEDQRYLSVKREDWTEFIKEHLNN